MKTFVVLLLALAVSRFEAKPFNNFHDETEGTI
jgi:hypothetical protein